MGYLYNLYCSRDAEIVSSQTPRILATDTMSLSPIDSCCCKSLHVIQLRWFL